MNYPIITKHTTVSFWDGVQKTQQTATHCTDRKLSMEATFMTRKYIKRDSHAVSLSSSTRILITNDSDVSIRFDLMDLYGANSQGLSIPPRDHFYAYLPAGEYELQLDTKADHEFSVTTITE